MFPVPPPRRGLVCQTGSRVCLLLLSLSACACAPHVYLGARRRQFALRAGEGRPVAATTTTPSRPVGAALVLPSLGGRGGQVRGLAGLGASPPFTAS